MDIKEAWGSFPAFVRRTSVWIGVLASIAAIYSTINVVSGVIVRPAWAWEIEALSRAQLETNLEIQQMNRREYNRNLSQYRSMREQFIRDGERVPGWLTNEISSGEHDLKRLDDLIRDIQTQLITN